MKKEIGVLLAGMILASAVGAVSLENISLKAGPTAPGEGLSLVWLEAQLSPKTLKADKLLSFGVQTTSKVKEVKATFDFNEDELALTSKDGMTWSGTYKVPEKLSVGLHVVRYQIIGARGSIQRTLDFYAEGSDVAAEKRSALPPAKDSGWQLTVTSTCTVLSGDSVRTLQAGQKVRSILKVSGYKVAFEDGKEGWVPATQVKDLAGDFFAQGYRYYRARNYTAAIKEYSNAVAANPEFSKGYLWLAKSYAAKRDLDSASEVLLRALQLDDRDVGIRVLASDIANRYFSFALSKAREGRDNEAILSFRKAVDLKPNSVASWVQMGQCLQRLGLEVEAREAWKEALKYDPENRNLHALLKTDYTPELASEEKKEPMTVAVVKSSVPAGVADDSLSILKKYKTTKGTAIEKAINSVVSMTKSLGTPVVEKGWQVSKQGQKFLVRYLCEQSGGALETFDWLVDVDTRQVLPHNENARLLMGRW